MRELQCFLAKHELSRRCVCVCDKAVLQCVRMLSLSANHVHPAAISTQASLFASRQWLAGLLAIGGGVDGRQIVGVGLAAAGTGLHQAGGGALERKTAPQRPGQRLLLPRNP